MYEFIILMIPFIGTSLGSLMVLFLKNSINNKVNKLLIGFSIGVMLASLIWSLLIPSIELSLESETFLIYPTVIGFILGVLFLLSIDLITSRIIKKNINKTILAITIHNIPEGMAVGIILMGAMMKLNEITLLNAFTLSLGIALQNIPEGAIVSIPLKLKGMSRKKAILKGIGSGAIEPIAGLISILLFSMFSFLLPYVLSFAGGAMLYVIIEELVPETKEGESSYLSIIGFTLGFVLMMIMDVIL